MSAKLATAAFVLSVLALVGPGSAQWSWSLQWEETETDRLALEAAGQANCVSEVVRAEDPLARCPAEATGWIHPAEGLRVLDDTYVVTGPTHPYKFTGWASTTAKNVEEGRRADYLSIVQMLLDGGNWRQDSEGEMPDIITPGVGNFVALYGWWADLDGDGVAEIKPIYANPGPDNEWVAKGGATVVSYVEPGSRPELTNRAQPGKSDPDIVYVSQGVYRQDYVILFLDGSLLRRTTVTTVADALLSADGEGRPYTADAYSRVDIDVYAALAPGPLEALYGAVAGEISDHYGAPSLGICPARCQPGPVPLGDSPAAPVAGAVAGLAFPPYPREWAPQSGNTAEGRLAEYQEAFLPWIDLLPKSTNPVWLASLFSGPLAGRSVDGAQSMAPGFFTLEAWIGLWKDLDRDGYVGDALDEDPYEGGTRPLPDDYSASGGEFIGAFARSTADPASGTKATIVATLVPDDDWGVLGVYPAVSEMPFGAPAWTSCEPTEPLCAVFDGPIELVLGIDPATLGRYAAGGTVFMPLGSPGFTVCTETLWVRQVLHGESLTETVRDCDRVERWMR